MSAPMPREEYLAVLMAPARQHQERSHALPAAAYRDPAESAKLESEKGLKKVKAKKTPKRNKKWR